MREGSPHTEKGQEVQMYIQESVTIDKLSD